MPSGTGKTISLLSLIVAYQRVSLAVRACELLCFETVLELWSTVASLHSLSHVCDNMFLSLRPFLWKSQNLFTALEQSLRLRR